MFSIQPIALLPAAVILVLAIAQVEVKRSMLVSIAVAIALALGLQHDSLLDLLRFMAIGFRLDEPSPLDAILLGSGILSMVKVSIVVIISTAFVGIFAGTQALQRTESQLEELSRGAIASSAPA